MILSVQRWRAGHGLLWMSFKEDLYFAVQMDPIVKRYCSRVGAAGCGLDSVLCRDGAITSSFKGILGSDDPNGQAAIEGSSWACWPFISYS